MAHGRAAAGFYKSVVQKEETPLPYNEPLSGVRFDPHEMSADAVMSSLITMASDLVVERSGARSPRRSHFG